jgi:hypothetical protein
MKDKMVNTIYRTISKGIFLILLINLAVTISLGKWDWLNVTAIIGWGYVIYYESKLLK